MHGGSGEKTAEKRGRRDKSHMQEMGSFLWKRKKDTLYLQGMQSFL